MNRNRILLAIPFLFSVIVTTLYHTHEQGTGMLFYCLFAIFVGLFFGFCLAVYYTRNQDPSDPDGIPVLNKAEEQIAITVGIGAFALTATLLIVSSLKITGFDKIDYRLTTHTHFFEIVLRIVVGIIVGATYYILSFFLLTWLIPWTGRKFQTTVTKLSATPVAAAPGVTPVVAPGGPTPTPAVKTDTNWLAWGFVVVSMMLIVGSIVNMVTSSQPTNNTAPTPVTAPVVTTPPVNNPNAAIQLQDESGKINH